MEGCNNYSSFALNTANISTYEKTTDTHHNPVIFLIQLY